MCREALMKQCIDCGQTELDVRPFKDIYARRTDAGETEYVCTDCADQEDLYNCPECGSPSVHSKTVMQIPISCNECEWQKGGFYQCPDCERYTSGTARDGTEGVCFYCNAELDI